MAKISIIVPVYNVEKHIKKTFDSLQNQTIGFKNLEVIFVDDCSTDNSANIIDEWDEKYNNVISIHLEENSGAAGKPRNVGLDNATSDYVLFLDSDDYLVDDACETLLNYSDNNSDITIGGYANKFPYKETIFINKGRLPKNTYNKPKKSLKLFNISPAISAKLFKRKFLIENNISFPIGIPGQDLVFLTSALFNSKSVTLINNYIVYYRIIRQMGNDKSISHNITPKYLMGLIKAYSIVLDLAEDNQIDEFIIKSIITNHLKYFINRINSSFITKKELIETFNSEHFGEFKNKNFFKRNYLEWNPIFNNIENDPIYTEKLIKIIRINNKYETNIMKLEEKNEKLKENIEYQKNIPKEITYSTSWKLTKPLRKISNLKK